MPMSSDAEERWYDFPDRFEGVDWSSATQALLLSKAPCLLRGALVERIGAGEKGAVSEMS
eukprot:3835324-Rhodomonas_salina.2